MAVDLEPYESILAEVKNAAEEFFNAREPEKEVTLRKNPLLDRVDEMNIILHQEIDDLEAVKTPILLILRHIFSQPPITVGDIIDKAIEADDYIKNKAKPEETGEVLEKYGRDVSKLADNFSKAKDAYEALQPASKKRPREEAEKEVTPPPKRPSP